MAPGSTGRRFVSTKVEVEGREELKIVELPDFGLPRTLTDTFAGIKPSSAPAFILAEVFAYGAQLREDVEATV